MPVTLSIQAVIDAQTAALNTTINAARDNVKADNVTQVTNQTTAINTTINAARDNVKADNVTQVTNQTTAINTNTNTKTSDVTTAVNAKGVVKSVQRGTASPFAGSNAAAVLSVTVSSVDIAKSVLVLAGGFVNNGGTPSYSGKITSATTIEIKGYANSSGYNNEIQWQLVEHF